MRLAFLLKQKGRLDEAIGVLEQGLADHPGIRQWMSSLASLYEDAGRSKDSLKLLRKAVKAYPRDKDLLMQLIMCLDSVGKQDEAMNLAGRLLHMDENFVPALNYLGYTYADKGIKLNRAEVLVKKALSLRPGDGYIVDSMGWVYYKKGELDKAVKYLERAHALAPGDPIVTEHLGDVYRKQGALYKALDIYKKALGLSEKEKDKERILLKIQEVQKKLADSVDD